MFTGLQPVTWPFGHSRICRSSLPPARRVDERYFPWRTYGARMAVDVAIWAKDPDDLVDFVLHWADWVRPGDAIDTHTIDPDVFEVGGQTPLLVTSTLHDDVDVTLWLDGGDEGSTYLLACEVVTTTGRRARRYVYVKVARQFAVAS